MIRHLLYIFQEWFMTPAYEAIHSIPSPDVAGPAPLPSTSGKATQSAICTAQWSL